MQLSRRNILQAELAFGAEQAANAQSAGRDATDAGLTPVNPDPNRRILLKNGTIVSMDPSVGDFVQGDILIQGKKIAAVGVNLKISGAAGDRCFELHLDSRLRRLPPPFLGRRPAAHHS